MNRTFSYGAHSHPKPSMKVNPSHIPNTITTLARLHILSSAMFIYLTSPYLSRAVSPTLLLLTTTPLATSTPTPTTTTAPHMATGFCFCESGATTPRPYVTTFVEAKKIRYLVNPLAAIFDLGYTHPVHLRNQMVHLSPLVHGECCGSASLL